MIRTEVEVRHDVWEGTGMLRPWGSQSEFIPVEYYFDVHTKVIKTPGLPPVDGQRSTNGTITGRNNEVLNEGFYELVMEQGQKFRVQNIGTWHILATP